MKNLKYYILSLLAVAAFVFPGLAGELTLAGGVYAQRSASFDSYDPEIDKSFDSYDQSVVNVKRSASFDLVMSNTSAVSLTFELFNYLKSFTKYLRADLVPASGGFTYVPENTVAITAVGATRWAANGDLSIMGTGAVGLTVHCNQFPYRGLFESSGITPFRLKHIRMTVTTPAQIDQEIRHFSNSFLGGNSSNSINPRTNFNPTQFQSLIIDVPMDVIIDAQKGLEYTLLPGEVVRWNTTIEGYVLNTAQ